MLYVFLGGGLGSVCRYLASRWLTNIVPSVFPLGTFLVNIVGCFLIGFFVFYFSRAGQSPPAWRLLLVTGFCGGFTTFSSFSLENTQLLDDNHVLLFLGYTVLSITLGLAGTYLGIIAARSL